MSADPVCEPLPSNGVLVHIGMHKTGTTAMQTLLGASRAALAEHRISYPGPRSDHHVVARSLTQRELGPGGVEKAPPPEVWQALAGTIVADDGKVVLSSEFFSAARDAQAVQLVQDLGAGRVHVLLGVRNMVQSMTSAWQQTLKQGRVSDVDAWAELSIPRAGRLPKDRRFWAHWDLGAVVRRWSAAAGAENVTVVVLDPQDRDRLPTTFEQLLGLPAGLLTSQQPPISNRGMTAREAELIRSVNTAVHGELGWPDYRRLVRNGVIRNLVESVRPAPEEPRSGLPGWARDEVLAAGERYAKDIAASGVHVVGDLGLLYAPVADRPTAGPIQDVPLDVAVAAVLGAIRAEPKPVPVVRIENFTSRELVRSLRRRARLRARRAVRRSG